MFEELKMVSGGNTRYQTLLSEAAVARFLDQHSPRTHLTRLLRLLADRLERRGLETLQPELLKE